MRIIVITGPTSSGKTKASLKVAENFQKSSVTTEIINADSIQLYRDLKTLTAFPSDEQLKRVPHNLFGILEPEQSFSVANWKVLAEEKIGELHRNGKIPIICGGTGFYINSLIYGIDDIPEVPLEYREKIYQHFLECGRENFFKKLQDLDPELCRKLHPNNTQRVLRAYEVATFTNKPLSFWWNQTKHPKYKDVQVFVILPNDLADVIYHNIQNMFDNGVIEEVAEFLKRYPNYSGPLNRVIGLQEIRDFLQTSCPINELIEKIFIKTRQYAKRQSTWFRNKMDNVKIVKSADEAVQLLHNLTA